MAFSLTNFDKLSLEGNPNVRKLFGYYNSGDTLATIKASAYFNDVDDYLSIGDMIYLTGSDGYDLVRVTAVSPNVTVAANVDADLASGQIWVGNASGEATAVTMSGDGTLSNTGVFAIASDSIVNADVNSAAAIEWSKLEALTDGQFLVGDASNVATDVAMSGDCTLANTGAVTLGTVVNASKAATYAPEAVIAGMPVLHVFNMAGGATATRSIATAQKITVVDAWAVLKGVGTASDTIQLKNNAGTAITDALDINVADESIVRAGTIDDANNVINSGDNLQCTITDGAGSDVPATDVYALCYVTA